MRYLGIILAFGLSSVVHAGTDAGDHATSALVDYVFETTSSDGSLVQLAGTPSLKVYKANSTTEDTAGVTLTVDFDGVTGLNHARVDTSGAFYATGNTFYVVIAAGTVDSVSVVGRVVGSFSVQNRVVASVSGAVGSVTGNVAGSVASVTGAVGSVAGNVGGSVASVAAGGITATSFGAAAIDAAAIAPDAFGASEVAADAGTELGTATWASATRTLTSFGTLTTDVWAAATRTLTSFGTLVADIETALADVTVTVSSPVTSEGDLEIIPGDAYDLDHGRQIDIEISGAPSLVGATVTLVIDGAFSVTATSVANAGSATQTPRFEIPAATSDDLTRFGTTAYRFQVQATWAADNPTQPAVLHRGDVSTIKRAAP